MQRVRIAVLGSCVVDLVFHMARMPAPGETLFAERSGLFPGGKGLNQAIAARRLGAAAVALIARVGRDPLGDYLRARLDDEGIDSSHVVTDGVVPTGVAVPVVFADGVNSILSSPGASLAVTVHDVLAAREMIASADALLLQFEAPMEANLTAATLARESGTRVVLNPAPVRDHPPQLLDLAHVLVVNEVEAAMLAGGDDAEAQAKQLLGRRELAVVTLGADGAVLATAAGVTRFPAFPVAAVDSVGAGDAFCGAFAVALAEGMAPADAVRFASAAGALSVTRAGAASSLPSRPEVEALLARATVPGRDSRLPRGSNGR